MRTNPQTAQLCAVRFKNISQWIWRGSTLRAPHRDQQTLRSAAKCMGAKIKHQCPCEISICGSLTSGSTPAPHIAQPTPQRKLRDARSYRPTIKPAGTSGIPAHECVPNRAGAHPVPARPYFIAKPRSLYRRKLGKQRDTCMPAPRTRP